MENKKKMKEEFKSVEELYRTEDLDINETFNTIMNLNINALFKDDSKDYSYYMERKNEKYTIPLGYQAVLPSSASEYNAINPITSINSSINNSIKSTTTIYDIYKTNESIIIEYKKIIRNHFFKNEVLKLLDFRIVGDILEITKSGGTRELKNNKTIKTKHNNKTIKTKHNNKTIKKYKTHTIKLKIKKNKSQLNGGTLHNTHITHSSRLNLFQQTILPLSNVLDKTSEIKIIIKSIKEHLGKVGLGYIGLVIDVSYKLIIVGNNLFRFQLSNFKFLEKINFEDTTELNAIIDLFEKFLVFKDNEIIKKLKTPGAINTAKEDIKKKLTDKGIALSEIIDDYSYDEGTDLGVEVKAPKTEFQKLQIVRTLKALGLIIKDKATAIAKNTIHKVKNLSKIESENNLVSKFNITLIYKEIIKLLILDVIKYRIQIIDNVDYLFETQIYNFFKLECFDGLFVPESSYAYISEIEKDIISCIAQIKSILTNKENIQRQYYMQLIIKLLKKLYYKKLPVKSADIIISYLNENKENTDFKACLLLIEELIKLKLKKILKTQIPEYDIKSNYDRICDIVISKKIDDYKFEKNNFNLIREQFKNIANSDKNLENCKSHFEEVLKKRGGQEADNTLPEINNPNSKSENNESNEINHFVEVGYNATLPENIKNILTKTIESYYIDALYIKSTSGIELSTIMHTTGNSPNSLKETRLG